MVNSVQSHGEAIENREAQPMTPPPNRRRMGEGYETGSHRSGASRADSGEHFTNMSRELSALVLNNNNDNNDSINGQLAMIGEEEEVVNGGGAAQRVKKEEVEAKISAWEKAKVAKINNRFKREDAVINGWENEQLLKSTSWLTKIERRLEEKRAKAVEKMQNEIAKSHGKAEERRASAEARRGTKVAEIVEIANLMRSAGRPPAKRSFK